MTVPTVTDNFVACAMLDLRPITLGDQGHHKNRIYFKSEVVVRGEDYGWVMWNGLSTAPQYSNNQWRGDINFPYNLILFKKENGNWKIDGGYSWDQYTQQTITNTVFSIVTPDGDWFKDRKYGAAEYFPPRRWAGIARVDKDGGTDILQSMGVWIDNKQYAEFFGNDGNWSESLAGYKDVRRVYVDGQGWKRQNSKDLSDDLKAWYKPFKDKKVRWTTLSDVCSSWSGTRNQKVATADKTMQNVCYRKK